MDSTPIPTFSESALESPQPPNPPRRVFVRVRMILAGIGVFCGPCIFYTFGFHYANWHCASWGLVSGTRAPPPPSQTNLHKYSYTRPVHRPPLEAFVRIQQRSHVAGSHLTCRPLHLRTLVALHLQRLKSHSTWPVAVASSVVLWRVSPQLDLETSSADYRWSRLDRSH